jgi:hypothetical protein
VQFKKKPAEPLKVVLPEKRRVRAYLQAKKEKSHT